MRYSVNIPNFGDFADARTVARVAAAAEEAGWDALFVWDHVVHDKQRRGDQPFGDPRMLLTAAALATSRIRLGPLVTPVARRRPEQLARQVATLDALSGGRVIFGAGLGGPIEDEFGSFGDTTDPVVLAERLDEGLDLLTRYWSGETVDHDGSSLPRARDRRSIRRPCSSRGRRCGSPGTGPTGVRCAAPPAGTVPSRCSSRRGTVRRRRPARCATWPRSSPRNAPGSPISRSTWWWVVPASRRPLPT